MRILITGAGSVMGQSIYKALCRINFPEKTDLHFANSDDRAAGRYFCDPRLPVTATPIFPLARDPGYVDFVESYCLTNQIDILYPGTQHELEKITQLHQRLPITATIPEQIAKLCLDKCQTPNVLAKHNVRFPFTMSLVEYLDSSVPDRPVLIKPITSSASRNIFRGRSKDEMQSLIQSHGLNPNHFVLQELLEGPEYTCGCYIDRYSGCVSTITFERTLTPDGATGYGKIVHDAEIQKYLVDTAKALQAEGMPFGHINVQLIKDANGPCLFEINGRLSSTEASKAHFGFNSCEAYFANIVLQQPYDRLLPDEKGEFLRYYEEVYF